MSEPVLKSWARVVWRKVKLGRLGLALVRDSAYDLRRYLAWSHGTDTDRTEVKRRHALYKAYHGVEKGLSLSEPRPGFGAAKIGLLTGQVRRKIEADGEQHATAALSALHDYQRFNATHEITNEPLARFLDKWPEDDGTGGAEPVTAAEIKAHGMKADHDFFWSRHSVRQFSDKPVDMDLMREVVEMARKTPTVCNRQGPRVHVFENAQEALDRQPGNRGFGHQASLGLVVTSDLQAFSGRGERHQAYTDGGMFSMSLLYALHAKGLGGCPLAWTTDTANDRATRKALGIPDNEVIIMMIAVGHLPETFSVARAHRMPLEDFLIEHPAR